MIEGDRVRGVVTQTGLRFDAPAVVLTAGTFLAGKIHVGDTPTTPPAAPATRPRCALAARLREAPFVVDRLKTGTPPRIDGRTLDYSVMEEQPGDDPRPVLSFMGTPPTTRARCSCWITHTSERTHEIIRGALDRSPLYTGQIEGIGPRYCPSIEDKVVRFAEKASHQIFVEPEGLDVAEIYPNGISTSLPFDVQLELVRSIRGFEQAHITRPGYAIEYDFFDPRGLKAYAGNQGGRRPVLRRPDQRHHRLRGSRRAGPARRRQRRALRAADAKAGRPRRDEAYLGVLVDDLITHGTHRAVPHVHLPRRIPAAAARGQRRPAPDAGRAASWAWSTTPAGPASRPSARRSRARRCG